MSFNPRCFIPSPADMRREKTQMNEVVEKREKEEAGKTGGSQRQVGRCTEHTAAAQKKISSPKKSRSASSYL